jgi:hypothetical protein
LLAVAAGATNVTGTWEVTIKKSNETITGKAGLKQVGNTVTGWVGYESDPIPVTGVLKGKKLTLRTHPQPGRTVEFDQCELTVNGKKMIGTIDTNKGKIEFVRNTCTAREPVADERRKQGLCPRCGNEVGSLRLLPRLPDCFRQRVEVSRAAWQPSTLKNYSGPPEDFGVPI